MTDESDTTGNEVNDGKTPASTRFRKGQSGNPRGRPVGRRRELPYEAVLGQMVTIRENGVERRVTAEEAFLLQLVRRGLDGDGAAARLLMPEIETARATRNRTVDPGPDTIITVFVTPGSVNSALEPLRIARKLDRYRTTARYVLEPWIVEAALDRLGERRLSIEEQRIVVRATRTPKKVKWPAWWKVKPLA